MHIKLNRGEMNMRCTNLDKVKHIAILFLHLEPKLIKDLPTFVSHPFIQSAFLADKNGLFDIFKEPERYQSIIEQYEKMIKLRKSAVSIFYLINNSYKLTFFSYCEKYLSEPDYSVCLREAWVQSEAPMQNINVSNSQILKFFLKATTLMSDEEQQFVNQLPEKVLVFRGVYSTTDPNIARNGISWTLSKDQAFWFSQRYNSTKRVVVQTEIPKELIIGYYNDRNEKEILLNYHKVHNVTICAANNDI